MYSVTAMKLNSMRKKADKLREKREAGNADLNAEIKLLKEIGHFYEKHQFDKAFPNATKFAIEYFRAAANLNDAEAQYLTGRRLMDLGLYWTEWFQSPYGAEIHSKYANNYFFEAYAYLKQGEENGHSLAKRLRGLGFVKAWGVAEDKDLGYKLIFESVDDEGSWDNIKDICKEWDIDSQELFGKIRNIKKQSSEDE